MRLLYQIFIDLGGNVKVSREYAVRVFDSQRKRDGGTLREDWDKKVTRCNLLLKLKAELVYTIPNPSVQGIWNMLRE